MNFANSGRVMRCIVGLANAMMPNSLALVQTGPRNAYSFANQWERQTSR